MNTPPHSIEAEKSLLGSLFMSDRDLPTLELTPEEFYLPVHTEIFRIMRHLESKSLKVDAITVMDRMRNGDENREGTKAFDAVDFTDLLTGHFIADNLHHYAAIIRSKARARRIVSTASEIAYMGMDDPGDDYPETASRLFTAACSSTSSVGPRKIQDVAKETHKHLFDRIEGKIAPGVSTGFPALDEALMGGFQPSDLIIVAGRPSMGKTALGLCTALNAAYLGHPSLFFSLEMSERQLCERMISADAELDMKKVRMGRASREEITRMSVSTDTVAKLPIEIDDSNLTLQELLARARRWALGLPKAPSGKKGLVIVDYLQLLKLGSKSKDTNREQEVAALSRGLKGLAKELDMPVTALAQLNRGVEQREDKRPMMSDLRESGGIEQDADVILFVYRDEVYHKEKAEKGKAEILIRKQRNGPNPLDIPLFYEEEFTKFRSYTFSDDF